MKRYHNVVLNSQTGFPVPTPTITVYLAGTTTLATIYSNEAGTSKANPFVGDASGRFDFYAADGDYDIKVEKAGITSYTLSDVTIAKYSAYQWAGGVNTALATSGTQYSYATGPINELSTTESLRQSLIGVATHIIGLRINLSAAPGSGASRTFTIRRNGAATAATVTISGASTTGVWTGTVAFAAGDLIGLECALSGTPAAAQLRFVVRVREIAP